MLVAVDEAIESDDDTELSLDCVRVAVGRRLEGAVEKGEATLPDEENPPKLALKGIGGACLMRGGSGGLFAPTPVEPRLDDKDDE